MWELVTVADSNGSNFYYTNSDGTESSAGYPFYISKANLKTIGDSITQSRQTIPVSFQGSFYNVMEKTEGTRAVDWLDFLLYVFPTLVVPYLPNNAAKDATLSLIKGCGLSLQWDITTQQIDQIRM